MIPPRPANVVSDMASRTARLMQESAALTRAYDALHNPLVQRGNALFQQMVDSQTTTFHSRRLKDVIKALQEFQTHPSVEQSRRMQTALEEWQKHNPNEIIERLGNQGHKVLQDLRNVAQARITIERLMPTHDQDKVNAMNPVVAGHPEAPGWNAMCPGTSLEEYRANLPTFQRKLGVQMLVQQSAEALKSRFAYVVRDAPELDKRAPGAKAQIKHRRAVLGSAPATLELVDKAHLKALSLMKCGPKQAPDGGSLANIRATLDQTRIGTGLGLAYCAAAEVLSRNNQHNRVEIIASKEAASVTPQLRYELVVARAQASRMQDRQSWGDDVQILGAWRIASDRASTAPQVWSILDTHEQVDVPDVPAPTLAEHRHLQMLDNLAVLGMR